MNYNYLTSRHAVLDITIKTINYESVLWSYFIDDDHVLCGMAPQLKPFLKQECGGGYF